MSKKLYVFNIVLLIPFLAILFFLNNWVITLLFGITLFAFLGAIETDTRQASLAFLRAIETDTQ